MLSSKFTVEKIIIGGINQPAAFMAQSAVVNTPHSAEVTWPICLTLLLAIPLGGLCAMVSLVLSMFYSSLPQKNYTWNFIKVLMKSKCIHTSIFLHTLMLSDVLFCQSMMLSRCY